MLVSNKWNDYECIDAGNGEKLERWGNIILRRPDPWALWTHKDTNEWNNYHAIYHRNDKGGGYWNNRKKFSDYWTVNYRDLTFKVSPTGFKHTGLFPEQAANWDFIIDKIQNAKREIKVLNLFAYTGGATMASSYAGAIEVVHVDASAGMNDWAKENAKLSHLENNKIRYICDDCLKFVEREKRRGNKYDAIIMDPPTYGRGPSKELWRFEDSLNKLIDADLPAGRRRRRRSPAGSGLQILRGPEARWVYRTACFCSAGRRTDRREKRPGQRIQRRIYDQSHRKRRSWRASGEFH